MCVVSTCPLCEIGDGENGNLGSRRRRLRRLRHGDLLLSVVFMVPILRGFYLRLKELEVYYEVVKKSELHYSSFFFFTVYAKTISNINPFHQCAAIHVLHYIQFFSV